MCGCVSLTICITGTGTGVGKTLLTALLTIHLRQRGVQALAIKPYCSGSLDDARVLSQANDNILSLKEISPVYCIPPVAPLAALNSQEAEELYIRVQDHVDSMKTRCDVLFVEGIGGAAVPLTNTKTIGHLMESVGEERITVGKNQLGILNDVLLTEHYFSSIGRTDSRIVLMEPEVVDPSCQTNAHALKQVLGISEIASLPYLGADASNITGLKQQEKKLRKTLVQILKSNTFISAERRKAKVQRSKANDNGSRS